MPGNRHWTKVEDTVLLTSKDGNKELSKLLGRSSLAISHRKTRLKQRKLKEEGMVKRASESKKLVEKFYGTKQSELRNPFETTQKKEISLGTSKIKSIELTNNSLIITFE